MAEANWRNRTMWTGDNLPVLRGLNSESVDLVYADPPFNSNRDYAAPIGSKAAGAAFKDTWTLGDVDEAWHGEIADREPSVYAAIDNAGIVHGKGMKSYLIMMAVRLLEIRRVLKPRGSLYLHCDDTAVHYLKTLLDAVFGRRAFRNDIVWQRTSAHNDPRRFGRVCDRLLYVAMPDAVFRPVMGELSEAQRQRYKSQDAQGLFKAEQLTAPHFSPTRTVEWRGTHPGKDRQWRFGLDELERLYADGRILLRRDGCPRKDGLKEYLHESRGAAVQDLWTDISRIPNTSSERVGYPTQKPLALLDRVISASTEEGDVVLDPFCGCATACVSAESLHRQWIGIDLSPLAAKLVETRLRDEFEIFAEIHHRTDVPRRTDTGPLPNYRTHKHQLFGRQEGRCAGCRVAFPFRNFTIDHRVPRSAGGTDHIDNLQLLCGACNSVKGQRDHGCTTGLWCAVRRRHSSAGANPARQLSFQPVAVGADDGGNDIA